jgi:hypothetical protein
MSITASSFATAQKHVTCEYSNTKLLRTDCTNANTRRDIKVRVSGISTLLLLQPLTYTRDDTDTRTLSIFRLSVSFDNAG